MEMGSNYLTVEGSSTTSSGSSDSLNGLKFGQKIYFEDVGLGVSGKSGGGSSSSSPPAPAAKKGGRRVLQSGQPPRCQVEGCKVDLSDAKAYYSRHKVCGMHSKSATVIVNGLEQRFCQQCSRFHLLNEFDQGKRSCRRRLAGHNERRRKPPPGSLLSSRLGRLSSSLFGDGASRGGGFLLDFSSYARHSGKDLWPGTRASERVPGSQSTSSGKYAHSMWPGSSEDPSSEMYLQGSAGGSSFSIPSGECITGVTSDSSCALSLLSNPTWGSRNRASSGIGLSSSSSLMNIDGATMSQCTMANSVTVAHFSNSSSSWGFKGNEPDEGLQVVPPYHDHLGLGQISQPLSSQFHSDLLMDQYHNNGRQYMDVDHSRPYNSAGTGHGHWSL